MKRKIIRIAIVLLVIAVIMLVAFGFTSRTAYYNGTLDEDGIESSTTLTVTYRRIDKLFNNMHGNVTIQTENEETLFEFTLFASIYVIPESGVCYTPISIYNETQNWLDNATLYFDKEWKNIALIYHGIDSVDQPRREFYSADETFQIFVSEFINPADLA